MAGYTIERVIKVYDDGSGEYVYIGPDADGLDMVELRACGEGGRITSRMAMTKEQALLVAKAINELYGDIPVPSNYEYR
jgi:hypothetical protein